jgi:hypothetical protein
LCSAGYGGLTHIAILFFVVELAAAGNRLGYWRGRARAILLLIVCCALVSICPLVKQRRHAAMLRPHIQRHDVPHFPGAMVVICVERRAAVGV